ncbi:hypothetical protein SAMN04488104_105918 [Algoriphagus faecimaris]|uniref:NVEALA protein n=1 Tax=Algoriphagus faecimaris TaxID=686796 RepID=A0A1G6XHT8_9BACT|nr:hypothetical protein [Algoriphagus faecimaris]SDD77769.1 hypothetical protein SAMN04488104_105918 [Algoriphagus faecimaris]
MFKLKFYHLGLVFSLMFGGSMISAINQSKSIGSELMAESNQDNPVCCDIYAEPVPPLCYTQIFPTYREYYGVAYLCVGG